MQNDLHDDDHVAVSLMIDWRTATDDDLYPRWNMVRILIVKVTMQGFKEIWDISHWHVGHILLNPK